MNLKHIRKFCFYGMVAMMTLVFVAIDLSPALAAEKIGTFQKILEADGDFAEITATLEKSIADSGLELLGQMDLAVPDNAQKCRTYVLTSPTFNEAAMGSISADAVSGLILRIGVYEADAKVHINIANPDALAHVYFEGESARERLLAAAASAKKELIRTIQSVQGRIVNAQQEPIREAKQYRGYNGDGPAKMLAKYRDFRASLLTAKEVDGATTLEQIIDEIKNRAAVTLQEDGEKGWKVVAVKVFDDNAAWLGITNLYTETKCININSDFRGGKSAGNRYPGVDHAPALPLEIVVYKGENGKWQVAHYGQMWRMQLYFWDSGYRAFMKNTLIPKIIADSIERMIKGS
ncbi:MAG: hypothetical protein R3231_04430 [bacterium]|nr:hypothetical protein [bacterium]